MKNYILYTFLLFTLFACQQEEMIPQTAPEQVGAETETPVLKGHVRIKLKADAAQRVNVRRTRSGVSSGIAALDLAHVDLSVYRMERVFPPAGKFEARHKEAGLDLWYDVYFDEKIATRSATRTLSGVPEVEYVEEIPEIHLCDYEVVQEPLEPLASLMRRGMTRADEQEEMPFNDPRLPEMWHYHNAGEAVNGLSGALEGADIGVFEAWKIETGSPEVIVAVMDGGIQYNHPDLVANMWVNEAELNGQDGVDDDNNGYVDDIYGWNFVTARNVAGPGVDSIRGNGAITQYEHGTHCAGTISAVNGNGIGISGIAGGSGNGDGVRLMSCQIFHTNPETGESEGTTDPNMYVYAADMGAVISSNSWTVTGDYAESAFMSSALRSAIDYFIKYAGTDVSTRQQNGPMNGGLVIFAAANENSDAKMWPAAYEKVLTVAAMSHNFKKAPYSNYGDWVNITAPGGDITYGENYAILSTSINSRYSWLQGTSMACPHMSGCAALVLSKFQGMGYTPDELRERLVNATHDIDPYNQKFNGLMGVGYIDVGLALTPPSLEAPDTSHLRLIDAYDDWAIVEWEVKAASDGPMSNYVIRWSTSPLQPETPVAVVETKTVNVRYVPAGTMLRDTIKGLTLGQTYYFTVNAHDRWGGVSDDAPQVSAVVNKNLPPVLSPDWQGSVVLNEGTERIVRIRVDEPEKQRIACIMSPALDWVEVENVGDTLLTFRIKPDYSVAGSYGLQLKVSDQYGKSAEMALPVEVLYKEVAPRQIQSLPDMRLVGVGRRTTLRLTDYFVDLKGRALMYEVENTAKNVISVQRNGDMLTVEARMPGHAEVMVRAKNEAGLTVSQRFSVEVVASEESRPEDALSIYPNVVKTGLTVTLHPSARGEVSLMLYNAAGRLMKLEKVMVGATGYQLDMSDMQAGTYVLVVEGVAGSWKKNIIKI
ncbi:MAG: S8 family serine peptidase [Odoribacter sp.]|nr:S8 family serine peptidase [Odoribacter sp.]